MNVAGRGVEFSLTEEGTGAGCRVEEQSSPRALRKDNLLGKEKCLSSLPASGPRHPGVYAPQLSSSAVAIYNHFGGKLQKNYNEENFTRDSLLQVQRHSVKIVANAVE